MAAQYCQTQIVHGWLLCFVLFHVSASIVLAGSLDLFAGEREISKYRVELPIFP